MDNNYYYCYVQKKINNQLPSVKKKAFGRLYRKCQAENVVAALILIGCKDVKQVCWANEILRIAIQCQMFVNEFAITHFVVL